MKFGDSIEASDTGVDMGSDGVRWGRDGDGGTPAASGCWLMSFVGQTSS